MVSFPNLLHNGFDFGHFLDNDVFLKLTLFFVVLGVGCSWCMVFFTFVFVMLAMVFSCWFFLMNSSFLFWWSYYFFHGNFGVHCFNLGDLGVHYTKMCFNSFQVSLDFEQIWKKNYHGEISQPISEQGLIIMDNELFH